MALAVVALLACIVLVWRDKATTMPTPARPVIDWPSAPVDRRRSLIVALTMVVAAGVVISRRARCRRRRRNRRRCLEAPDHRRDRAWPDRVAGSVDPSPTDPVPTRGEPVVACCVRRSSSIRLARRGAAAGRHDCRRLPHGSARASSVKTRVTRPATLPLGSRAVLQRAAHDPDAPQARRRFTLGTRDHRGRRRLDRQHATDPRRHRRSHRTRRLARAKQRQGRSTADRISAGDLRVRHRPGRRSRIRPERVRRSAATGPRRQGRRRLRVTVPLRSTTPRPLLLALDGQPDVDPRLQHVHRSQPQRHGDVLQALPPRGPRIHHDRGGPVRVRAGDHRQGRQGGWRIYEVGISYNGRTYADGKKIGGRARFAQYCIVRYSRVGDRIRRRS